MHRLKYIFATFSLLLIMGSLLAQKENKYIRKGNSEYDEKNFAKAEENYIRSLNKGGDIHKGLFNLGDVYYERKDYQSAGALFDSVARLPVNPDTRSKAFYNLGNSLLSASIESDSLAAQALPLSIESYKQALRLNPVDTAAKYNLAYAQALLKDQQQDQQQNQDQQNQDQQNQDQQNQDQQDQQDQEDQEDQEQDQEQDQKQDQQQDQQQQQDQDQQKGNPEQQQSQPQQQPRQISKEDAERMLEAMKNDEKKTLEKVKTGKMKVKVVKSDKDW
ncbi:MAG: tetratricopeptide repeat protein [Bacteroidota bacterium]